jgi:hypothetical protein
MHGPGYIQYTTHRHIHSSLLLKASPQLTTRIRKRWFNNCSRGVERSGGRSDGFASPERSSRRLDRPFASYSSRRKSRRKRNRKRPKAETGERRNPTCYTVVHRHRVMCGVVWCPGFLLGPSYEMASFANRQMVFRHGKWPRGCRSMGNQECKLHQCWTKGQHEEAIPITSEAALVGRAD